MASPEMHVSNDGNLPQEYLELIGTIRNTFLMNQSDKSKLVLALIDHPELFDDIKKYFDTYVPYEARILAEMNPEIEKQVRSLQNQLENSERLAEQKNIDNEVNAINFI